jgi:hypothetical protein
MLIDDQRALDGLLFARRLAPRLRREEVRESPSLSLPCQATAAPAESPAEPDRLTSIFTPEELGRLAMYRAAVEADLYTDRV